MEKDPEMKGDGNSYTTEFRQYDPRLGRWLSLDPLMQMFPSISPYVAFDNNPIFYTDPLGLESGTGEGDPPKLDPETGQEWVKGAQWIDEGTNDIWIHDGLKMVKLAPTEVTEFVLSIPNPVSERSQYLATVFARGSSDGFTNSLSLGSYFWWGGDHTNEYSEDKEAKWAYLSGIVAGDLLAISTGKVEQAGGAAAIATAEVAAVGSGGTLAIGSGIAIIAGNVLIAHGRSVTIFARINAIWISGKVAILAIQLHKHGTEGSSDDDEDAGGREYSKGKKEKRH